MSRYPSLARIAPFPSAARRRRPTPLAEAQPGDLDRKAWVALIDEQRRLIAEAAGVDPAQVIIHLGYSRRVH